MQAQILLVIKCCYDQWCKVTSLPLLLFTELMKLNVLYATAHLKATLMIHTRKIKKKKEKATTHFFSFSFTILPAASSLSLTLTILV